MGKSSKYIIGLRTKPGVRKYSFHNGLTKSIWDNKLLVAVLIACAAILLFWYSVIAYICTHNVLEGVL